MSQLSKAKTKLLSTRKALFTKAMENGGDSVVVDWTSLPPTVILRGKNVAVTWVGEAPVDTDPIAITTVDTVVGGVVALADGSKFENPKQSAMSK